MDIFSPALSEQSKNTLSEKIDSHIDIYVDFLEYNQIVMWVVDVLKNEGYALTDNPDSLVYDLMQQTKDAHSMLAAIDKLYEASLDAKVEEPTFTDGDASLNSINQPKTSSPRMSK